MLRVIIILAVALSAAACNVNVNSDQANRLANIRDSLKREETELRARNEEARRNRSLELQRKVQLPGSISLSGAAGRDARILVVLEFGRDNLGQPPQGIQNVGSFVTLDDNMPAIEQNLQGALLVGCDEADLHELLMTPRFAEAAAEARIPGSDDLKRRHFRAQTLFICGTQSDGGPVSLQAQRIIFKSVRWSLEQYISGDRPALVLETESLELLGDSVIEGNKCATSPKAQDPTIAIATKLPAQGPGVLFLNQRGADLPESLK